MTVLDRLELYADAGETSAPLKLWKNQILQLRKDGFTVEEIAPTERRAEYFCTIDWSQPNIPESLANEMLKMSINALNGRVDSKDRVPTPYSVNL